MEAESSHLSRVFTPEQDPAPATERNEAQTNERVLGSDLIVTDCDYSGLHKLLDQIQGIASPILQFSLKRNDIDEHFTKLESLLKERTVEVELKESSVKERIVELEKKEEEVIERERKVELVEKSVALSLEENEMKQCLLSSLLTRFDCETADEAANVLEERLKEVERISKCNDDKSRELDMAVKEFDLKQKEWIESMSKDAEMVKESLKQVEVREKELSLLDECIKEKVTELEKKEKTFEAEQKAKAEEMDVKEKKLEEREKELDLKQRELEQVMDKLKERELQERAGSLIRPAKRHKTQASEEEEEPEKIKIADSEFHDFKKTMSSFVVGKIWALYDPRDDMPRLYAKIKKITKYKCSLDVTWFDPKDEESVPVACGRFTDGRTETVSHLTFSHEVKPIIHFSKFIAVNPKEGETWAVFRHHKLPYRYDLVEVVEVFEDNQGVGVTYLGKVEGFVSVFKHVVQHGVLEEVIGPKEMKRFSHRVPSVRLSGEEREGVPAGSFELDPAAVPSYILLGEKEV